MRIHSFIPGVIMPVLLAGMLAGCGGGLTADSRSDYDGLIDDGWSEYNRGRYDEAYRLFVRAKDSDTSKPEAYIGCGWALLRRQHPDSSAVVFKLGLSYIDALADSVDTITGLSGAYLANGNNNKAATILKDYPVSDVARGFPLRKHDFLLESGHLEIVQSMALYRLGLYSPAESADPDNAVYHLNRVLAKPYTYKNPQELLPKITEYLDRTRGGPSL
ncbi:MAG: tetratricopeptide repeat protein [Candidatus Latescibacterota bacterium]